MGLVIQDLYKVERKAKEEKLSPDKVKELRLKESLPVINDIGYFGVMMPVISVKPCHLKDHTII